MNADALFAGSHKNSTAFSWVGLALGSKIPTDSGISAHTHTKVRRQPLPNTEGKDPRYGLKLVCFETTAEMKLSFAHLCWQIAWQELFDAFILSYGKFLLISI